MNNSKIWLSSPHIGSKEQSYVYEAFQTNWIAPLGPHVNQFELDLSYYANGNYVAALNSGTSAIHLALILLGTKAGDDIFCQSLTFSATANPIKYLGANPIFIDSEMDSWNMDPELLKMALLKSREKGKLPKAIIPVHLYGMPAKMDEICKIASEFSVPVIEDAAEAIGSKIGNKYCGGIGDLGVFSFNGNKIITTSGGGALTSANISFIEKAKFLATQARDPAPHYQHSKIGYNYRLSNVLAGIGRGQLEVLPERINSRIENYEKYISFFREWNIKGFDFKFQCGFPNAFSNRWLTAILINPENNKGLNSEQIRLHLDKFNIESRPIWKPMHLQPIFSDCEYYENGTSEKLFKEGICLPSGSNLTTGEFNRIFSALNELINQY